MTNRHEVYFAIDGERDYQDVLPLDRTAGQVLSQGEELVLMKEYMDRAIRAFTDAPGVNPEEGLHVIRKVVAIGVRCMEHHGAPCRVKRTGIEKARATFRAVFSKDPDFRRVYQDNIAMLLHDRHGITGQKERNAAADDIISLVFEK